MLSSCSTPTAKELIYFFHQITSNVELDWSSFIWKSSIKQGELNSGNFTYYRKLIIRPFTFSSAMFPFILRSTDYLRIISSFRLRRIRTSFVTFLKSMVIIRTWCMLDSYWNGRFRITAFCDKSGWLNYFYEW